MQADPSDGWFFNDSEETLKIELRCTDGMLYGSWLVGPGITLMLQWPLGREPGGHLQWWGGTKRGMTEIGMPFFYEHGIAVIADFGIAMIARKELCNEWSV